MAGIFISYTSGDQAWAFWIAKAIEALGYKPFVHQWEIQAGEDILAWMEKRFDDADHALLVISATYLLKGKEYSGWERRSAEWAAAKNPGFALPVYVEKCEAPRLLQNFRRCDLYDLDEDAARAALAAYLAPAGPPSGAVGFPGRSKADDALTAPEAFPFPGKHSATPSEEQNKPVAALQPAALPPGNMSNLETGIDQFLSLARYYKRIITGALVGSIAPVLAGVANLAPPWPPAVVPMTSLFELTILIMTFQFMQGAKRSKINKVMISAGILTFVFVFLYLGLLSEFVFQEPLSKLRFVKGFNCTEEAKMVFPADCPFFTDDELAKNEWEAQRFWSLASITVVRIGLAVNWFLVFSGLAAIIGSFIVYQMKQKARNY